jgi:hypothetical protein
MNDLKDKYKEIIGNKFNELSKHQQEVNLYIYDIFTKNGVKVTEELAKEYCQKVTDLLRISFNKGMESQKQIDDITIQELLNKFPNKESKK